MVPGSPIVRHATFNPPLLMPTCILFLPGVYMCGTVFHLLLLSLCLCSCLSPQPTAICHHPLPNYTTHCHDQPCYWQLTDLRLKKHQDSFPVVLFVFKELSGLISCNELYSLFSRGPQAELASRPILYPTRANRIIVLLNSRASL